MRWGVYKIFAKDLLASENHIKEAVGIFFLLIELSHGGTSTGHTSLINKDKESLSRMKLQSASVLNIQALK